MYDENQEAVKYVLNKEDFDAWQIGRSDSWNGL
jgi:hypothetical protein